MFGFSFGFGSVVVFLLPTTVHSWVVEVVATFGSIVAIVAKVGGFSGWV